MHYKLVALDLDGTLLNSEGERVMKLTIDDERRINGWQDTEVPASLRIRANHEHFKEFMHHQSSKSNGLKRVLELYGIDPSEMIAIGDFYNDLDIIEYAGMGIAMGNSPNDVKQRANDVTLSNDEDGVYYALEKHLHG